MMDRNEAIQRIRKALKQRSGKSWSVTGGRGTAWGWITVSAPPARRTWRSRLKEGAVTNAPDDYESYDSGEPGGSMGPVDKAELAALFNVPHGVAHGGIGIPSSTAYYVEYVDRAEGREPSMKGEPYWD